MQQNAIHVEVAAPHHAKRLQDHPVMLGVGAELASVAPMVAGAVAGGERGGDASGDDSDEESPAKRQECKGRQSHRYHTWSRKTTD